MNNDYRLNNFSAVNFCIRNEKKIFMEKFRELHPRAKNIYTYVSKRQTRENQLFRQIYSNRCAYCGISTQILSSSNFEVDHVLAQANNKKKYPVHSLDNLVCSCSLCNRGKSDFDCSDDNYGLLHPDENKLPTVFFRDNSYYIQVREEYRCNDNIIQFYRSLKFDNELRRLDFFIMELKDFCKKYEDDDLSTKLKAIIERVEQKRRDNY